ncbi:hypothetical protein [Peptostreptococcus anaerobius]|uniref:hypothetical protein n=1 Tax=Peptostreptococcus anaerobius TaxID=1261 RepID=UPI002902735A|nr:hypothetical protein [Peptostreptococcus anaerobius]MDU1174217.1 hypothetical protein [Peptostreptococcus anaerobius]MDU1232727.1 hypothetical protein [Peptostreptococcus anaerobius]MDU5096963.1 hypothetical protein [Peptostreptococcus anaerobius]
MKELNLNGIFNKRDYVFDSYVTRNTSKKNRIFVNFIGDGNVKMRYKEYDLNNDLISHYIVDDIYCIRTLGEDLQNKTSWALPHDITIEVLNTTKANIDRLESYLGSLLRLLYDKHGYSSKNVSYRGVIGNVNYNRVISISNEKITNTAEYIFVHNQRPNLLKLGELLKVSSFKKVKNVYIDGNPIGGQELADICFQNKGYYINNINPGNDIEASLNYLRRFIDSRIRSTSKIKNFEYVCYFDDKNKPLAELFGLLCNVRKPVFKDNGKTMPGSEIGRLKDSGKLLYIGAYSQNPAENAVQFINKYLI